MEIRPPGFLVRGWSQELNGSVRCSGDALRPGCGTDEKTIYLKTANCIPAGAPPPPAAVIIALRCAHSYFSRSTAAPRRARATRAGARPSSLRERRGCPGDQGVFSAPPPVSGHTRVD
eukprot:scaffold30156_cov65-Phaeocystis_antarctica.AAC.7